VYLLFFPDDYYIDASWLLEVTTAHTATTRYVWRTAGRTGLLRADSDRPVILPADVRL
jgi:hypothetical protein